MEAKDLGFHTRATPVEERACRREALDAGIACPLCNHEHQLVTGYDGTGFFTAGPYPEKLHRHLTFGNWQQWGENVNARSYGASREAPAMGPRAARRCADHHFNSPLQRRKVVDPPFQHRGIDMNFTPQTAIAIVVAILAAIGIFSSFYTVQPEERAVVKRFGAVIGQAGPGLHFKIPFGVDDIQKVATERVLKQEFGFRTMSTRGERTRYSEADYREESQMLTGDLNVIDVSWVVQYRIQDPVKFLYQLRGPERTLRDISESVMRRLVGNRLGSDVLTTARVEIAEQGREEIQQAMAGYDSGIHINTVELQDVIPPARVRPAFNEVNEARQERERMINEAMKQRNQAIPQARGQANRIVAEAEGYATERVNRARGEVARFDAILAEYRAAPAVTRQRLYLETLREVVPKAGKILVVQGAGADPLPLLHMQDLPPQIQGVAQQ